MGSPYQANLEKLSEHLEMLRGNISLREAATRSGLSHAYIRDLELGHNRGTRDKIIPSPDTLKKLAQAYGGSYAYLMTLAGHVEPGQLEILELLETLSSEQLYELKNYIIQMKTG